MTAEILLPHDGGFERFYNSCICEPFDDVAVTFIQSLSQELLALSSSEYAELIALGFWCRDQKIKMMRDDTLHSFKDKKIRAKGTVFQIAPGNVSTQFMYSTLLALLMGNRVLVRVSSKTSDELTCLLKLVNSLLTEKQYSLLSERILLVRCEHNDDCLIDASLRCDIRVIWGGDQAINTIRQIPLSSHAKEISFADRASICVVSAESICRLDSTDNIVSALRTDVLTYQQQACSSPKMMVWVGTSRNVDLAKKKLWKAFDHHLEALIDGQNVKTIAADMERIVTLQSLSVSEPMTITKSVGGLFRASLRDHKAIIEKSLFDAHNGHGILIETEFESLGDLTTRLGFRFQTLTYCGFEREELIEGLGAEALDYFDRIELLGSALDFHYIWDGYNLLHEFCRVIR